MEALNYTRGGGGLALCGLCPRRCRIPVGRKGFCRTRWNDHGVLKALSYGRITSAALDPIEKKPLAYFHPGSLILSVGSYGCNMCCPFCQNWEISQEEAPYRVVSPQQLADLAAELTERGNIGLAYTYNEPALSLEFILDTAPLIHRRGLVNVMVTNGCYTEETVRLLLPHIDAWNIDLKGFTDDFYKTCGGDLETVKRTIELAAARSHVELTNLIIPGMNDDEAAFTAMVRWIASVSPAIPLHLTRFFPRWHLQDRGPTPVFTLVKLGGLARKVLARVNIGNVSPAELAEQGWRNHSGK